MALQLFRMSNSFFIAKQEPSRPTVWSLLVPATTKAVANRKRDGMFVAGQGKAAREIGGESGAAEPKIVTEEALVLFRG